ncbi:MAG: hypothetical protein AB7F43_14680 [Bacteriovoracia bacterium]
MNPFDFMDERIRRKRKADGERKQQAAYASLLQAVRHRLQTELNETPCPLFTEPLLKPLLQELPESLCIRFEQASRLHGELKQQRAYNGTLPELARVAPYIDLWQRFPPSRLPILVEKNLAVCLGDDEFLKTFVQTLFQTYDYQSEAKSLSVVEQLERSEEKLLAFHKGQSAFSAALRIYVDETLMALREALAEYCGLSLLVYNGVIRDLLEAETILASAQGTQTQLILARQSAIDNAQSIHARNMQFYEEREERALASLRRSFWTIDQLQQQVEMGCLTVLDMQALLRYQTSEENALRRYLYSVAELFTQADVVIDTGPVESVFLLFGQLPKRRHFLFEKLQELCEQKHKLPPPLYLDLLQQQEYAYSSFAYDRLGEWFVQGSKATTLTFYEHLQAHDLLTAIPGLDDTQKRLRSLDDSTPEPSKTSFLQRAERELGN